MQATSTQDAAPFGLTAQSLRPRKSPQAVQVLAIADATGSSGPFARGISHILDALATSLPERIASVRFGLVASRDADCGEHDETLLADGDATALQQAAQRIRFVGGDDADETHFWSVRDALGYGWADGPMRRKAILLIGSSDSKPIPGMTLEQLVVKLSERRITVFVVATPDSNLQLLATLTDGLLFALSNEPSAEELQRLTARLTSSITQTLSQALNGRGLEVVAL